MWRADTKCMRRLFDVALSCLATFQSSFCAPSPDHPCPEHPTANHSLSNVHEWAVHELFAAADATARSILGNRSSWSDLDAAETSACSELLSGAVDAPGMPVWLSNALSAVNLCLSFCFAAEMAMKLTAYGYTP